VTPAVLALTLPGVEVGVWQVRSRADRAACALADRHDSRQRPGSGQVGPPGRKLVLVTPCERAVWVAHWPDPQLALDRLGAWRCSLFRNQGAGQSSELIRAAMARTAARWPDAASPWRYPVTTINDPARPAPGDLLAALGSELAPGRAAEVYAACGFPVVAMHGIRGDGGCTCPRSLGCPDPGKHPRLADWPAAASATPAQVRGWWRRWPTANVGLCTGLRFDVLDVDGPRGEVELRALAEAGAVPGGGPLARTGGGGWHVLLVPTGAGNRVGLRPGLDWRGRGGLIVAPPSVHRSGQRYRWVRPLTATLPEVPDGLRRLLAPPRTVRATLPPVSGPAGRAGAYARAALDREAHRVATAKAGTCNHTLNRAAFSLGQLAAAGLLDADEIRARLLAAALAAPAGTHSDRERRARATIESGLAAGARTPRRRGAGDPP